MARPEITIELIESQVAAEIFRRGEKYFADGAVQQPRVRGELYEASVQGNDYAPYRVRATFLQDGIHATCSCPYTFTYGDWCKHIVAALLTYVRRPEEVMERESLEEQIAELTPDQREELLHILSRDPDLADRIESYLVRLKLLASPSERGGEEPAGVDVSAFRRLLRNLIRESGPGPDEYYDYYDSYDEEPPIILDEPVALIQSQVEAGQRGNALALLEALMDELVVIGDEWVRTEDMAWEVLDDLWCQALLSSALGEAERRRWGKKLLGWDGVLDEFRLGGVLGGAQLAAEQGWEGEPVQSWLQGNPWEDEEWDEEHNALQIVADAVLAILERRGDDAAFLNVAHATGQGIRYLLKLVEIGEGARAAEESAQWITLPGEAEQLARALLESGNAESALRVGEHGLDLETEVRHHPLYNFPISYAGAKLHLARWLAPLAESLGRNDLALRGHRIVFEVDPDLARYEKMRDLAGEEWEGELKPRLLSTIRKQTGFLAILPRAEILLREGLVEDAMRLAGATHDTPTLRRVMDAVLSTHPGWVIEQAQYRAENIINAGSSGSYEEAVEWLRYVRDATRGTGRDEEWARYIAALTARHRRKYKLMGLLKNLHG